MLLQYVIPFNAIMSININQYISNISTYNILFIKVKYLSSLLCKVRSFLNKFEKCLPTALYIVIRQFCYECKLFVFKSKYRYQKMFN